MGRSLRTGLISAIMVCTTAGAANAQDDSWEWSGLVAEGKALEIKNVNGDVEARPGTGASVEVRARKYGRDDPSRVRIEVLEHADGVTICAVYPDVRGKRPNECGPGGEGRMNTRDTKVTVDFDVILPTGVSFVGKTVNGSVRGNGLRGDVRATTVNGSVEVETTGWAEASTVNGEVRAVLGRADWSGTAEFATVNGDIALTVPADINTEVHASTVNGDLTSDFPVTVQGRFGPRRVSGTIGSGGRRLELKTVNGSIRIRKE